MNGRSISGVRGEGRGVLGGGEAWGMRDEGWGVRLTIDGFPL